MRKHDRLLFNNLGWKVKLFSLRERVEFARVEWRGLTGLCIASCSSIERSRMHKLKRESYLLLCDALGDFALGCFFSKGGGSKVIGSSE